jgi:ABC-type Fe3+ transport system permease subunit
LKCERVIAVRLVIVLSGVILAVLILSLQNGQIFTNSLIALLLLLGPIVRAWAISISSRSPDHRRSWLLLTVVLALFAFSIVANLPSAYRSQKQFNETKRRAEDAATEATAKGR